MTHSRGQKPNVIFVQPAVPAYRRAFFEAIYETLGPRLKVYASSPDMGALTQGSKQYDWLTPLSDLKDFGPLTWQRGALSIAFSRNDIVVLPVGPRTVSNIFLLIKAKLSGAKIIGWGHFWSSTSCQYRANIRYVLMKTPDALLFYTDEEIELYQAKFKTSRKPVFALNNGIDIKPITQHRAQYAAKARKTDMLFIGRLTVKTELDILINAMALPEMARFTLSVIGDGEYGEAYKSLAQKLNVDKRITWHKGTTDEVEIAKIANDCKVFVYPGGVGLSLIHSLAYGLPAVVHDDRWKHMPEIAALEADVSGVTFEYQQAHSLVATLAGLLNDPQKLNTLSEGAIATTRDDYNTDSMAARFLDMLEHDAFSSQHIATEA